MAGQQILVLLIEVRILAREPDFTGCLHFQDGSLPGTDGAIFVFKKHSFRHTGDW